MQNVYLGMAYLCKVYCLQENVETNLTLSFQLPELITYFCYQNASHNSLSNELHYYCRPYQIMNNIDNENQKLNHRTPCIFFF